MSRPLLGSRRQVVTVGISVLAAGGLVAGAWSGPIEDSQERLRATDDGK